MRLESELDFVRAQQRELEEMLIPLEESLQQEVNNMPHDAEREHTYYVLFSVIGSRNSLMIICLDTNWLKISTRR